MPKYMWFFIGGAVIVLIVVFRKQIGSFFGNQPKDGDACTDTNGNPSTIVNGSCKEVIIPPSNLVDSRIILNVPSTIRVRRYGACLATIQVSQYPGYRWAFTGSDIYYCYYRRI